MPKVNTIKLKLSLLIAVPLTGLLVVGFILSVMAWGHKTEARSVQKLTELSIEASELAHALQEERGMSAGFVASEGKNFRHELPVAQETTDKTKAAFEEGVSTLQPESFGISVRSLGSSLQQLDNFRQRVRSQSVSVQETLTFYTKNIRELLKIPEEIALHSLEPKLTSAAVEYTAILNAKEYAGIERGVLAAAFANKKLSAEQLEKLIRSNEAQETYLRNFMQFASKEDGDLLQKFYRSEATKQANQLARKALLAGVGAPLITSPSIWFEAQSAKIAGLKKIENHLSEELDTIGQQLASKSTTMFWGILALIIAAVGASLALGLNILHKIARETSTINMVLEKVAHGDLTELDINYDDAGASKDTLLKLCSSLREISRAIKITTATVGDNSRDIAENNTALAQRAEEQAISLERTASSMEEITVTVAQNADDVRDANSLAKRAMAQAEDGQEVVSNAICAMKEINEDSTKIAEIINLIDDIAFQTNLLALNAAVEAARAGDQGRGFAVVATEVRNLAGRSAAAASEIKALIEDSVKKVRQGSELVSNSGHSLDEIAESIQQVRSLMDKIATASEEQSIGVAQINQSMLELDDANQQNTAMVEEVAVASSELQRQAEQLRETAAFFKIDDAPPFQGIRAATSHTAEPQAAPQEERRSGARPWGDNTAEQKAAKPVALASGGEDWERF